MPLSVYPWLTRSLSLMVVGAVLAFATTLHLPHLDVPRIGLILLAVGALDFATSLSMALAARGPRVRRARRARRIADPWPAEPGGPVAGNRPAEHPTLRMPRPPYEG